jgi:cardiolipin synthase
MSDHRGERAEADPDLETSVVSGSLTLPNAITVFRLILIAPFIYLVIRDRFGWAMAVFFFAAISDWFDGYLARRLSQNSRLGRILDPLADKILAASAYIIMAIPRGDDGFYIPVWLAVAVVTRDLLIVGGSLGVYLRTGFKEFRPTFVSKVNTGLESLLIGSFLAAHYSGFFKALLIPLYIAVSVTLIWSATGYALMGARLLRSSAGRH